jgi:hypothetical protein
MLQYNPNSGYISYDTWWGKLFKISCRYWMSAIFHATRSMFLGDMASAGGAAVLNMNINTTNLDGAPQGRCTLQLHGGRLMVDGQPVLATRPLGSRIVLIVPGGLHCVSIIDYNHIMKATAVVG